MDKPFKPIQESLVVLFINPEILSSEVRQISDPDLSVLIWCGLSLKATSLYSHRSVSYNEEILPLEAPYPYLRGPPDELKHLEDKP